MILKVLIPIALATGLLGGGIKHHFQGQGPCGHFAVVEAKLKLTAEQKKAIHQVFEQHRPALAARTEALVQARNAAMDAGMDPQVTAEAWRPAQEKFAEAARDLAKEIRAAYLEALPTLSESQKAEGKALLLQFHSRVAAMQGKGPHHEMARYLLKNRLDLTDAQDATIQAILESRRPALKVKMEALHRLHGSAMDAALDPSSSPEMLDQNFAKILDAGFALSSEVRATYLEAQAQLTPEQRQKAKALVQDFRSAMDGIRRLLVGF